MAAEPRRAGDQALPRRIGRYEAFLQIGAGGTARVYLAVQRGKLGQKAELVVVKVLRPEVVEDEHVQALFSDEARIAMRLEHPNVIRTREVIAEPPDYLLAMDFQNGQSLLDVLSRLGRQAVPLDEHIYILSKVLAGLSYAHELMDENGQPFGIVHRDVSPANVLVSYNGDVKLLDFGIAKATGALAATRDGVVKGKLGYAAPEQCLGQPADPRSDVYAVGVMLWEAIAGKRRASGETWQSVLQARLDDSEPELEDVCPDAPQALAAIVKKALARNPNDRYSTAREFESDLNQYLGEKRGVPIGPSRIAAMLKPHFDRDRANLHRSVEAFLKTLKSGGGSQVRRIPLPGAAAPAPAAPPALAATATPVSPPTAPAEEEHTAPIPVDAALLMLSRGETGPAPKGESATPTAPPRAPSIEQASAPPESSTPTVPPNSVRTTAPPPPEAASPPSAALPSVEPPSAEPEKAPVLPVQPAVLPSPPKSSPLATDAYGLVTVSKAVPVPSMLGAAAPKKKAPVWAFLLIAAGTVGLGALVMVPRLNAAKDHVSAPPAPTASAAPVSAPATAVEKVDTVKVRISVDPADAVVKLDAYVLEGNPFVGVLPRDNAVHELRVFAEGCRDQKQSVHLNRDLGLLVALKCDNAVIRAKVRASTAPRSASAVAARTPSRPAAEPPPAAPTAAEPPKEPPPPPPAEPAKAGAADDDPSKRPDMFEGRK